MRKLDKSGFTLVEIMIVVTIIGLLTAVAIPNFVSAREKAIERACEANLSQLESALELYRIDNGFWPADLDELSPYLNTIPASCPGNGGTYIYDSDTGTVSCTIAAHNT